MMQCNLEGKHIGKIHSIQTLGTLDGPGVRFVVFAAGCNLRCGCCHNPDTWEMAGGKEYTASELVNKALKYKSYFGKKGGVTFSGGEPILQADFVRDFFELSRENGMNTCLDTSGSILNDGVKALLKVTDRVLLDIKYHTDELYREYVGCSLSAPLEFLEYLQKNNIPVTLRQVIIPTLNDNPDNFEFLKKIISSYSCIDSVELLPFKKICTVKYENMGIPFRFKDIDVPKKEDVARMQSELADFVHKKDE